MFKNNQKTIAWILATIIILVTVSILSTGYYKVYAEKVELEEEKDSLSKKTLKLEEEKENIENKLEENNKAADKEKKKLKKDMQKKEDKIKRLEKDLSAKKEREEEKRKLASSQNSDKGKNKGENNNKNKKSDNSGKVMHMEATAYNDSPKSQGQWVGQTATGVKPQRGIIAVDPNVIPLGTKVHVEGYGEAVAADTGGAIKGDIIDVFLDTESEVYNWGRKQVKVTILD